MKIIDCITYFNEPLLFEIRLNILNEYVDEFLVCEAKYNHASTLHLSLKVLRLVENQVANLLVVMHVLMIAKLVKIK